MAQLSSVKNSKIHRPRIVKRIIPRLRLFDKLDRGLSDRLILVSAPAGYGKTTLISSWLENSRVVHSPERVLPSAWLTIEESDSDIFTFVIYLIASLRSIFPDACNKTVELIQGQQNPPVDLLSTMLCNEINRLPGDFIVVLDDYHLLQGDEIHRLVSDLLKNSQKGLHVLVIARRNPPLPLASFRVKGLATEIRIRDIKFSRDEMDAFIRQELSIRLTEDELDLLEEQTDGWAAGLRLITLALQDQTQARTRLASLGGNSSSVSDYLVDEVLSRQLPVIQAFLLRISILDRFCAPLCEAVISDIDPAWKPSECLEWIVKDDLFISSYGQGDEWFTFHRLFREVLQKRLRAGLSHAKMLELHQRASIWFRDHGYFDEALTHAITAEDPDLAATVVENGIRESLNREDRLSLDRWLKLIPEEFMSHHPGLLILKAWSAQYEWQLDAQSAILEEIDDLLTEQSGNNLPAENLKLLQGQALTMKGQGAYFQGQPDRALAYLTEARKLVPLSWTYLSGRLLLYMSLSMLAKGQAEDAIRFLLEESGQLQSDPFLRRSLGLCFIHLTTAKLNELKETAELMFTQADEKHLIIMATWARLFLGIAAYLNNELDLAQMHFTEVASRRYSAQTLTVRDGLTGLALVHQARGESAEAFRMVDTLIQMDLEQIGIESPRTRSLRARLWHLNGDHLKSTKWSETIKKVQRLQPLTWLEEPQLTLAFILTESGRKEDVVKAGRILEKLEADALDTHNSRFLAQVLVQKTLTLAAQKKNAESQAALRQAIKLSEAGNMARIFIDLGPQMQLLLARLPQMGSYSSFVKSTLAGFNQRTSSADVEAPDKLLAGHDLKPVVPGMIEHLTSRELELLNLMREPISNKQIASRLGLSYTTIKRYSINLYSKLGVNNRWDAVAKGIQLGILADRNRSS